MFRKASNKELVYVVIVIAICTGFYSFSQWTPWFYVMAFFIFLTGFIFRKQTKKDILLDSLGLFLLVLIITVGEYVI